MLYKLQKALEEIKVSEEISVSFDVSELSILIALVKANDVYVKSMEENMLKVFDK